MKTFFKNLRLMFNHDISATIVAAARNAENAQATAQKTADDLVCVNGALSKDVDDLIEWRDGLDLTDRCGNTLDDYDLDDINTAMDKIDELEQTLNEKAEIDYEDLASEIDYDDLADNIDYYEFEKWIEYDDLANRIDYDELSDAIDYDTLAEKMGYDKMESVKREADVDSRIEDLEKTIAELKKRLEEFENAPCDGICQFAKTTAEKVKKLEDQMLKIGSVFNGIECTLFNVVEINQHENGTSYAEIKGYNESINR